jgi:hypothetical protein
MAINDTNYTTGFVKAALFCSIYFAFPLLSAQDSAQFSLQSVRNEAEKRYGPDAGLIKGAKYYYPYHTARGDPFLEKEIGELAIVKIDGRIYKNRRIRYDIYNQIMVLDYQDGSGAMASIRLPYERLEYVRLNGRCFRKFPGDKSPGRFGQVIHWDSIGCIYFWHKEYRLNMQDGEGKYAFSDPMRRSFVLENGKYRQFNRKRSFLKCYPGYYKKPIKRYIKENRIRIRKASDTEMKSLMKFIIQLSSHEK